MSADNYELVGLVAALDLRDNVGGLDGSADLVRNRKVCPHRMGGGQEAGDALAVFTGDDHHGDAVNLSFGRIRVAVEDVVFAGGHEEDRFGFSLHGKADYGRCLGVLGEKISPSFQDRRVHQDYFS